MNKKITESIRVLLTEIIDYAGLFPPSQLSMPEAVINYATYKNSNYAWMLGRFVVPVGRLGEFTEQAEDFFSRDKSVWKLSVLASEDIYETVRLVEEFNFTHAPYAHCDTLEIKANSVSRIKKISEAVPPSFTNFIEIPIQENLADLVTELSAEKQCAKIRTGGTTIDAFPQTKVITRFIRTCLSANVPFKATAGLHHPLRCRKPLTYEKDAPTGTMFGFLNVFLTAAFARNGCKSRLLDKLLEDESAENFAFDDHGVLWRDEHFVGISQIKYLREKCAISFGSCSFEEPIADLQELGLL